MKWPVVFVVGLCIIFFACWIAYRTAYPNFEWSRRLTLVVETPQGDRQGSSLVWSRLFFYPKILPDAGNKHWDGSGEATVVDLGGGKLLFALLRNGDVVQGAFGELLPERKASKEALKAYHRALKRLQGMPARPVPPETLPMLVTFGDINDPTSIALVDPQNMAQSFGDGYALKEALLEITTDPATSGQIDQVLPWLSSYGQWIRIPTPEGRPIALEWRDFVRKPLFELSPLGDVAALLVKGKKGTFL